MLFYSIPQSHVLIFERFGKFSRIVHSGLAIKIPFIEKVKVLPEWQGKCIKNNQFIELAEQQTDTLPRPCQTKDNVTIEVNASVYWKITDPYKAVYQVDLLPRSLSDLALNALRANVGMLKLDELIAERKLLNAKILEQLLEINKSWGIEFTRVEVQEINYSDETATAMMQEMAAERKKRAMIAEAEGKSIADLKLAQTEAETILINTSARVDAIEKLAKAEEKYLSLLSEHVGIEMAVQILISQKYIDGMNIITKNAGHKVFLPNNWQGLGFHLNNH